jgi:nitronate monooxygenase
MSWQTLFTSRFHPLARLPLMGPPMIGVSGGAWAAAVQEAGALGFVAAGHLADGQGLAEQIAIYRAHTKVPLCLGFIGYSATDPSSVEAWARYEQVLDEERPAVVQFFAPAVTHHPVTGQSNVALAQSYGAKVLAQVGNVQASAQALEAGVDGLIVQGSEAGGHGLRPPLGRGLLPLLADVKTLVEARQQQHGSDAVPVLAAGGLTTGRLVAAALLAGADGAVLGTRLWASVEALGSGAGKQALVAAASCDAVVRTTVVDQVQNSYVSLPWPVPYDSLGVLRNSVTEAWEGRADALKLALESTDDTINPAPAYQEANRQEDVAHGSVLAGQGVGQIPTIERVADILSTIEEEMMASIQSLPTRLWGEQGDT